MKENVLFPAGGFGKNKFWSRYESFCRCWWREKNLFLVEGPTPELNDTAMTIEKSIELISLNLERNFV